MENSPRKLVWFFCVFCAVIFMNLFVAFNSEKVLSKDLNIPIYIIKNDGASEIFIDRTELENYSIQNVILLNSKSNHKIHAVLVNEKFFINENLNSNDEYVLKISLLDTTSKKNIEYSSNFKYVETNFSVKNIALNSCEVVVNYSGKDLLLINGFSIYGKDISNLENDYDFIVKKSKDDLNTYKSTFSFKDVSIKPGTNYKISCMASMNNNINLVFNKEFSTKDFEITKLKSSMVGDKKIKLDWGISDKNFKFVGKDSIKIFVKQFGELNYLSIPNAKISKSGIYSTTLELENVSSEYEIKFVYYLGGKEIEKTIKQINNFYELNSKISMVNSRTVKILFGFDNKFKFKNGEILNIYLVDEESGYINHEKMFSQEINSISFNPYHKIEIGNLKVDNEYKLIYEIAYDDGIVLKVKEDKFNTPQFGIKNLNISGLVDGQNNLKVSLNWQLIKSKIKFIDGDSLSIFIKEKDAPDYSNNPYFYTDKNLDEISSIEIDVKGEIKGAYDVKFIYNLGGKTYTEFKSLYINSEAMTRSIFKRNVPSDVVTDNPKVYGEIVKVTVKDVGVNQVTFEAVYPKNFEFTDGDFIKLYKKEKNTRSEDILVKEFKHSSEEDSKLDLKTMTTFTIDNLIPNRNYDFKIVFETHKQFEKEQQPEIETPEPETPPADEETNDTNQGNEQKPGEDNSDSSEGDDPPKEESKDEVEDEKPNQGSGDSTDDGENSDSDGSEEIPEDGTESDTTDEPTQDENQETNEEQQISKSSRSNPTSSTNKVKYVKEIKIDSIQMKDFSIKTFETETVRTNSAVFNWTISEDNMEFGENDKVEIFIKRKIVGGYPAGSSFSKVGSEVKGILSGEVIVQYMNMDYTAKLVYLISGVKFEKTVDFVTKPGTISCSTKEPTEHSIKLLVNYPEEYKFLDGDSMQVYIKEIQETNYGKVPIVTVFHDEEQKLQDVTTINLIYLKPKMTYEILIKFINKANDIPDCTTQFSTAPVIFQNCRAESLNGDKLRIKTDFKNGEDVFENIKFELYVDVFQKFPENQNYLNGILASMSADETLDFEFTLPDKFSDRDFLISFNPHGYFNDTLFIDFEIPYRTIRAVINESEITQDNSKKKSYSVNWAYHEPIEFSNGDKINIYLKELSDKNLLQGKQDDSTNKTSDGFVKIQTIDSDLQNTTSFNLDYFVNENKNYEIMVELASEKFKVGPGKVTLEVGNIKLEGSNSGNSSNEDIIFDVPITVEDFSGLGNSLVFNLPEAVGSVASISEKDIVSDIEGLSFELNNNDLKVKGLVPGKEYEKIEVKVKVEEGKEVVFNIQNVKLDAENEAQAFLYDVYKKSFLRDPDEMGYKYWMDRLETKDISARNFLINLLFAEKEFSEMNYDTKEFITVLYSIIVNREPDSEGLDFWIKFYKDDALVNSNGDQFAAKKYIVDRMINEKEFEKLMVSMGLEY